MPSKEFDVQSALLLLDCDEDDDYIENEKTGEYYIQEYLPATENKLASDSLVLRFYLVIYIYLN